jgi:Zn-dependent peptidase ImmA (M78 family)
MGSSICNISSRPDYFKAKAEAIRILNEFGLSEPPVNPADIAQQLGIRVVFVGFTPEYDSISGFYDFDDETIYVNKHEFPLRQTFTIAHELGHRLLHTEWAKSSDYKVLLRGDANGDDPIEMEANSFAANLLVPRFMLDKYWKELPPEHLSALFAVSVPVIRYRISFEYGA